MIPIEYFWMALILVFGLIGSARGLRKELGTSAILLLSLFALYMLEALLLNRLAFTKDRLTGWPALSLNAFYWIVSIMFVAFISYEGVTLQFPVKELKGIGKGFFGFLGGLLNGYLFIGTIWNALAFANYFRPKVNIVTGPLSELHSNLVALLPISIMADVSPWIFFILGMILLLAIVLK